jgi:hypothetical protein
MNKHNSFFFVFFFLSFVFFLLISNGKSTPKQTPKQKQPRNSTIAKVETEATPEADAEKAN